MKSRKPLGPGALVLWTVRCDFKAPSGSLPTRCGAWDSDTPFPDDLQALAPSDVLCPRWRSFWSVNVTWRSRCTFGGCHSDARYGDAAAAGDPVRTEKVPARSRTLELWKRGSLVDGRGSRPERKWVELKLGICGWRPPSRVGVVGGKTGVSSAAEGPSWRAGRGVLGAL